MTTGERIRAIRKLKGMTQKQVGDNCGMPDSAIRKYEHNTITPKHETLQRITKALDVPFYCFMFNDDEFQRWLDATTEGRYIGEVRIKLDETQNEEPDFDRLRELISLIQSETDAKVRAEYIEELKIHQEAFNQTVATIHELLPQLWDMQSGKIEEAFRVIINNVSEAFSSLSGESQKAAISYINYLKAQENSFDGDADE